MNQVTIALAKGRLARKTMEILNQIGITCKAMNEDNRRLVFESDDKRFRFFLSKASDVPTYVDYGVADIGIVGKDTILEENRNVYEVLDLGFGACKMVVAGRPSKSTLLDSGKFLRVATKYPHIASTYFDKKHMTVELIKLHGSVELGPIVELSDVIVDIVESGTTLRENGLVILDEIVPLSARCIVNPASMKVKTAMIEEVLTCFENYLEGGI